MSELLDKQMKFSLMVADFVHWVYSHPGWALTYGEAQRSDEQAQINALGYTGRSRLVSLIEPLFPALADAIENNGKNGGIVKTLHSLSLAVDFHFFIHGVYQTDSAAYLPLGVQWELMGGAWGGRFMRTLPDGRIVPAPDGNHFSLPHDGIR